MTTLDEAISVFWDGIEEREWPIESFQEWLVTTGEQPRPVPVIGAAPGQYQPLWITPWFKLFAHWCKVHGRAPTVFVRDAGDFVGELAQGRMPDVASRMAGMTTIAMQQGKEFYDVEVSRPSLGFVASPEGVCFLWRGGLGGQRGFSWYENTRAGAARALWPREPGNTFFNMTGGKKIEAGFWGAAPSLAQDAEAAVQGLLGYRRR